jgi:hypothetical protein
MVAVDSLSVVGIRGRIDLAKSFISYIKKRQVKRYKR